MKLMRGWTGAWFLALAASLLLLLIWACSGSSTPPSAAPPSTLSGYSFIRGTVIAVVGTPSAGKVGAVALPQASVFLIPFGDRAHPIASTTSDLSGRFVLKTKERGLFALCIEAIGFTSGGDERCANKELRIENANVDVGEIQIRPRPDQKMASVFGTVRLRDGHLPRGFHPSLGLNAVATTEVATPGGPATYSGFVNNLGDYVIPQVPVRDTFTIKFAIEREVLNYELGPSPAIFAGGAYELGAVFGNAAPRMRMLTATDPAGKQIQVAAPGTKLTLHAVVDDPDGDALQYWWALPDGAIVGPTSDADLSWTVPNAKQRYPIRIVASDGRGGYAQNGVSIDASSQRATFSGTVVDSAGNAVEQAQIDVNGRLISTNSTGAFGFNVPIADQYVMSIRKPGLSGSNLPGFGTASYVYRASVPAGRWTLRRAEVTTVDPTRPIILQQQAPDCSGPLTSQIDWGPYLNEGLFDWQDGRGNSLALVDLGRESRAVQNVIRLLGRMDISVARHLSKLTGVSAEIDDRKPGCGPGIKVEIPANALVDTRTGRRPGGAVQVALSSVTLTNGEQMPGDYTAVDASGKSFSMESFGAGSIEIGDATQRYNLAPGMTATVTIPIDATQRAGGASPAPTIPLVYFDERRGVWGPELQATLTGTGAAAAYTAKVKHFSTINADILKSGQSCVAVELDPSLNALLPLRVEVVMQPSVVNPGVIQVRQDLLFNTATPSAIYNLPNNSNIVLTPLTAGTLPDGSSGNVPVGVFVVNTGGPQVGGGGPPNANPDGSYYAESGGLPIGPCASRVTLRALNPPVLVAPDEFLQGLSFQSSNITEVSATDPAVAAAIEDGARDYYVQADPRDLRASFNLFKQKNRFGEPLAATELEEDAQYANSGDLGFGRDMHCRRNVGTDGAFDYACYVTNFGQPPIFLPDQQDADDTADPSKADATVAMEFSRVENPPGDLNEFFDNVRAVKFFVYDTAQPDDTTRVLKADLDGRGARPVPQLCMVCHGGTLSSLAADPLDPSVPQTKGAFADSDDIKGMRANFLPFDLHLYKFPASNSKAAQQAAFKTLNLEIVRGVSAATGTGAAIIEAIDDSFYLGGSVQQLEDQVVPNWDPGNPSSNPHKLYQNVIARACRTCHIARPFGAPTFSARADFDTLIGSVQQKVCTQKVMPHALRTNQIFWQSLNPNMPAFLQLYGQTLPGWSPGGAAQCGLFFQPGTVAVSQFQSQILPVLQARCAGGACHSAVGNSSFGVSQPASTVYDELLNAPASDGTSYIAPNNSGASKLFIRISTGGVGVRMPKNQPALDTRDLDSDGITDQAEILNWINAGAAGP